MATGLDRILEQIRADAEEKAAAEIAAAERDAEQTLARAAEEAEEKAAAMCAQSETQSADILAKAQSAAEFGRRRILLATKQGAIRDTVSAARERLHSLPDSEYFAVLLKLAQKNAADGEAQMRLNAKDLARMPRDFEAQLNAATLRGHITVSETPCDIADGFLLVYGGIDVNCTFDSLFEAEADALQDLAGSMLFR